MAVTTLRSIAPGGLPKDVDKFSLPQVALAAWYGVARMAEDTFEECVQGKKKKAGMSYPGPGESESYRWDIDVAIYNGAR